MNTKVSIVFSIIAAVLLFAASPVITHDAIAATTSTPTTPTTPTIVNPPATTTCPVGTMPETTTTGTVCLLIPSGGYGYGTGFWPHYGHHLY
jgi:hypothetical protein